MKIALGADHAGFRHKERIRAALAAEGHECVDLGTASEQSCDYPDYALAVARAVAERRADRGVLVCGTGNGMAIAANKVRGVRAAVCHDAFTAEMSRRHNDANVFCAGARVLEVEAVLGLLAVWLAAPFDGGRHEPRVRKIQGAEGG